jgi:hypothetical protein
MEPSMKLIKADSMHYALWSYLLKWGSERERKSETRENLRWGIITKEKLLAYFCFFISYYVQST